MRFYLIFDGFLIPSSAVGFKVFTKGENQVEEGINDKISKLIAKKAAIDAQIQREKQRQAVQERKKEMRRKMILGEICSLEIKKNPNGEFVRTLKKLMEKHDLSAQDKNVLDLQNLPSSTSTPPTVQLTKKFQGRYVPIALEDLI